MPTWLGSIIPCIQQITRVNWSLLKWDFEFTWNAGWLMKIPLKCFIMTSPDIINSPKEPLGAFLPKNLKGCCPKTEVMVLPTQTIHYQNYHIYIYNIYLVSSPKWVAFKWSLPKKTTNNKNNLSPKSSAKLHRQFPLARRFVLTATGGYTERPRRGENYTMVTKKANAI